MQNCSENAFQTYRENVNRAWNSIYRIAKYSSCIGTTSKTKSVTRTKL